MTNLFVDGPTKSHSGLVLQEKIECDALVDADWYCLARMISRRLNCRFTQVIGVPRGGLRLAAQLRELVIDPNLRREQVLVVDDVLTTGASLLEVLESQSLDAAGFVVFDRSNKPLPPRVRALFTLNP